MPFPIQSGSITERTRKFFRIRGKTNFTLDEVVAPVVVVQDLTKGPYQAGVTPAAGELLWDVAIAPDSSVMAVILNDKIGSVTEVLDRQFDDRSFSMTWFEMQLVPAVALESLSQLQFFIAPRSVVFAGIPNKSTQLTSIQNNDGTRGVPVEMFGFDAGLALGDKIIWRGVLGDNINILGSRRTMEPEPNITIGPKDALCLRNGTPPSPDAQQVYTSIRGLYQEQPA